ncbi:MAG: DUF167 domain-containing protein, partial [Acidimicrobiales bacterium]
KPHRFRARRVVRRMTSLDELFTADDTGVVLSVHATAGAGRSEVVGRHGDAIKIRVAAAPEKGRANDALTELLAHHFNLDASAVSLVSGATRRAKRFRLEGVDADRATDRLEQMLAGDGRKGPRRPR